MPSVPPPRGSMKNTTMRATVRAAPGSRSHGSITYVVHRRKVRRIAPHRRSRLWSDTLQASPRRGAALSRFETGRHRLHACVHRRRPQFSRPSAVGAERRWALPHMVRRLIDALLRGSGGRPALLSNSASRRFSRRAFGGSASFRLVALSLPSRGSSPFPGRVRDVHPVRRPHQVSAFSHHVLRNQLWQVSCRELGLACELATNAASR